MNRRLLASLLLASLTACSSSPSGTSTSSTTSAATSAGSTGTTEGSSTGSSASSAGTTTASSTTTAASSSAGGTSGGSTNGTSSTSGTASGSSGSGSAASTGSSGSSGSTGTPSCDVHDAGLGPDAGTLFVDSTDSWGLGFDGGLGLVGNRMSSSDLDGDGYPDLIVSNSAPNQRSVVPLPDGGRTALNVHLLLNRPRPGGGRMFVEATEGSGLFQVRGSDGGVGLRSAQIAVAGDVDNDGDLDVVSGTFVDANSAGTDPGDRTEVLLNDGSAHFTLATASDIRPGANSRLATSGVTLTDYDRDGRLDAFVGYWYVRYGQTQYGNQAGLFRGNGNGTFSYASFDAGLGTDIRGFDQGTNSRPAYGVTSCDLDDDGAPELLISAYGRQWNQLYKNDGSGKFVDVGQQSGFAGDSNRNFSDNEFFRCYCTLHRPLTDGGGDEQCRGVARPQTQCPSPADSYWQPGVDDQPWRLNGNSFSTYCGDVDGDGKPDLYTAMIKHWHIGQSSDSSELLVSRSTPGNMLFDRPGNTATGMVWPHPTTDWNEGGLFVMGDDFDHDARTDLLVGASDYPDQYGLLWHQLANGQFEDAAARFGIRHPCLSGMTVADFDRDGDLDVIVGSGTARDCRLTWSRNEIHLYENHLDGRGRWLEVKLRGNGTSANRSGIGAKVIVEAGGVRQVKELQAGFGHMGMQHDTVLHFGLGQCANGVRVTVRWPDRGQTTEVWDGITSNRLIELRQGDTQVH